MTELPDGWLIHPDNPAFCYHPATKEVVHRTAIHQLLQARTIAATQTTFRVADTAEATAIRAALKAVYDREIPGIEPDLDVFALSFVQDWMKHPLIGIPLANLVEAMTDTLAQFDALTEGGIDAKMARHWKTMVVCGLYNAITSKPANG